MSSLSSQPVPYPTADNRLEWKAYWEAQGQSWRTGPEIDKKRLTTVPDVEQRGGVLRSVRAGLAVSAI